MHEDIIREIRKQCRLAMNGVASTSMREHGLEYKLNFGLMIGQIKDIADRQTAHAALAEQLWTEQTRELKILATLLYPIASFTQDRANQWVKEIPNQEIREQVCLNLFQELSYARDLAETWSKSDDKSIRTTGYWLLARLFVSKKTIEDLSINDFKYITNDIVDESLFVRNAASIALKHIGRQSKEDADIILRHIEVYQNDNDPIKQEAYNTLAFEFEYIWG